MDWTLFSRKFLPNSNYFVRKLSTNKKPILHRIRIGKYNPEKPPENNYQETHWQIGNNIAVPQHDLYTIAWKAEFGGHLFDIPIIYTDPNAIHFDESHTQEPDTVIVPRSYFHDPSDGQNRETCPSSDPTVSHSSKPKSHGQSQNIETTADLTNNDSSKQTSEPSTDTEITYEPMAQPPLSRMTSLQRLKPTILLLKTFRKTNLVILEAVIAIYALIRILNTQKNTDIDVCKSLIQSLFVRHVHRSPFFFSFFRTHHSNFFFQGRTYIYQSSITITEINRIPTFKRV